MGRSGPLLTEAQWKKIAHLLPKPHKNRRGCCPWIDNHRVLQGILWILRSSLAELAQGVSCGWLIVISPTIPQDSPSCYDSLMGILPFFSSISSPPWLGCSVRVGSVPRCSRS